MILERLELQNKKLNFVDFLRVIINIGLCICIDNRYQIYNKSTKNGCPLI